MALGEGEGFAVYGYLGRVVRLICSDEVSEGHAQAFLPDTEGSCCSAGSIYSDADGILERRESSCHFVDIRGLVGSTRQLFGKRGIPRH